MDMYFALCKSATSSINFSCLLRKLVFCILVSVTIPGHGQDSPHSLSCSPTVIGTENVLLCERPLQATEQMHWKDLLALLFSFVALVVAVAALVYTIRENRKARLRSV